jgi:hypothetical protein
MGGRWLAHMVGGFSEAIMPPSVSLLIGLLLVWAVATGKAQGILNQIRGSGPTGGGGSSGGGSGAGSNTDAFPDIGGNTITDPSQIEFPDVFPDTVQNPDFDTSGQNA